MPSNYVLLQRIELNATAASVTFTNIPQSGYTDLKIVGSTRQSGNADGNQMGITFNGSSSGYSRKVLLGDGANAQSYSGSSEAYTRISFAQSSTYTANTFNNFEVHIPNYTSASNKSFSSDAVTENSAATSYASINAGLWSNTAAITSITLSEYSGSSTSFVQYSTFSLYGLAASGTTPVIAPKASGGNITTDGTYWIHTFNSTGTFTPATSLTCDYLVVAGGAGGGNHAAGGGGAGGLRSTVTATGGGGSLESALSVTAQAYTVTVGAGGAGMVSQGNSGVSLPGNDGTNSTFSTITSVGGGGGGAIGATTGRAGGSGGGGGGAATSSGGSGTANQGYSGGAANSSQSGGGGGAGASGSTSNGGAGVAVAISGSSVTYGGGGGGAASASGGTGGSGGGGNGGNNSGANPTSGSVNTGSGGGAHWYSMGTNSTNAGGSGIVIIRYAM
jgi:hypothetical protein